MADRHSVPDAFAAVIPSEALEALLLQAFRAGEGACASHAEACPAPPWLPPGLAPAPTRLRLDALDLTLHGHCAERVVGRGRERRRETVFFLGRPSGWRRLLRRPPLVDCILRARASGVSVALVRVVGPTAQAPGKGEHAAAVRLSADWQAQLDQALGAIGAPAGPTAWRARLRDWWRALRNPA